MQQNTPEIIKQKNSKLSILLIVVNLILLLIFASIEDDDNYRETAYLLLIFGATFLLGCYAFSYHGKAYRVAKWLFAISLIISLILGGLLWYATALAGAFKN